MKFKILPETSDSAFSGERFLPSMQGDLELEHLHRYLLASQFCNGKIVLDLACGEGYGSYLLSQMAAMVTAVDIDLETIEIAKKKYQAAKIDFQAANCICTNLPDHSFDVIVSFETIEHIVEQDSFLVEIKRLLKSDGVLIISTPNTEVYNKGRQLENHFHLKELTVGEFNSLLKKNFKYVSLASQRNFYGSVCLPYQGNSIGKDFSYFSRVADEIESNLIAEPAYMIATCSDSADVSAGLSLYESGIKFSNVDALVGGIKERDLRFLQQQAEKLKIQEDFQQQLLEARDEISFLKSQILPIRILIKNKILRMLGKVVN